jgi:glycosyltransferase involved in cell wall biosynthesis
MGAVGAKMICFDVGRIRYLNPLVIKKFISLIKERQIALIHTDSSTETFYAGIAARIMRIPLIWHIRVNEREWFLDRILSMLSTKLILVANAISKRFPWLKNNCKMVVIHNGIDLNEFDNFPAISSIREEFDINRNTVLLGCIGRIELRKGLEHLISAMKHLDGVQLILIGSGKEEYISGLKNICEALGISDRIFFIGPRTDIPAVLNEIDILVFPAIRGEGFPRVILEAMAAGRPVVATDNAGNCEAVVNGLTGYIVRTGDVPELVTKTKLLILDKEKRKVMGRAGRKRVEALFTIRKNVKSIQELYLDILERHNER